MTIETILNISLAMHFVWLVLGLLQVRANTAIIKYMNVTDQIDDAVRARLDNHQAAITALLTKEKP